MTHPEHSAGGEIAVGASVENTLYPKMIGKKGCEVVAILEGMVGIRGILKSVDKYGGLIVSEVSIDGGIVRIETLRTFDWEGVIAMWAVSP